MSSVKIVVEATPGEIVGSTAANALAWDAWARMGGCNPLVVFVHNDTEVTVFHGDTVRALTDRWDEQRATAREPSRQDKLDAAARDHFDEQHLDTDLSRNGWRRR